MTEIDQTTQLNASMAEQATAASQSLANECAGLLRLVGQFRLNETRSGRSIPPPVSDGTARSAA